MKFQSRVICLFLVFSIVSSYGCAGLGSFSAGQVWSKNYALAEGVQANDPAIIDGDINTVGQSHDVAGSSSVQALLAESESVVTLPEPKSIHRVTIYSDNLQAFDLWMMDLQGRWERIKEIKGNRKPFIDLRLKKAVYALGVKIRVRRTADDAAMRQKNVRRGRRGSMTLSGKTHAPARIAEIELYGFVREGDT